ncbi:MAG: ATPase [Desulfurococcus sp.]|nr:ATPase [Desulfurococcus sp.]
MLVVGLLPQDSGKTTVARALAGELKKKHKVFYFKPIAGHSGWYQAETISFSLEAGLLVGHDAYVVARELGLLDKLRLVNPVDLLTMPLDLLRFQGSVRFYVDSMSSVVSQAVLLRVSHPKSIDEYYVVRDNVEKLGDFTRRILDSLIDKFSRAESTVFHEVESRSVAGILGNTELHSELGGIYEDLGDYDFVVTESYNNSSTPLDSSLNADLVLVVAPTRLLLYDGSRYRQAVRALAFGRPAWSVEVASVVDILKKPRYTASIPYAWSSEFNEFISSLAEIIGDQ